MPARINIAGVFTAKRDAGIVHAEIHNPELPTSLSSQCLSLQFNRDLYQLVNEARIPKLFGSETFCHCKAMVRGCLRLSTTERNAAMVDSITSLELVHEYKSGLVSYVFCFEDVLASRPAESGLLACLALYPLAVSNIRLYGQIRHRPATSETTLLPLDHPGIDLVNPLVIDCHRLAPLAGHLTLEESPLPTAGLGPMMTAFCVAEGELAEMPLPAGGELFIPKVLTIACGGALHRLWASPSAFRWFVDDALHAVLS